ncbi:Crp/Fnr family transcriptional regulator [Tianweitania sp. BSSL-BM11]|uniref:Crp/Fnr family transcriptional regulator n=1 Tax=Tianweitania aestuarii TaxID=2814886 RepID=A0ABS5RWX9_9HYPH|nr:Crp/Fnr family transcriptional regulator [Tianweitania aestuarii]
MKQPDPEDAAVAGTSSLCPTCVEWRCGVGSLLTPDEARQIAAVSVRRQVPAGTELMATPNLRDSCIALLRGVVKVSRLLTDGRQQIVSLKSAPDLLGAPFAPPGEVSVRAVTEADIYCVPRHAFEAVVRQNRGLEHRLHLRALEDLSEAEALLLTLGRKTARERLATFLLDMAGRFRPAEIGKRCDTLDPAYDHDTLDLPLTRAEIGDFLGLTFETVSRQFAALRRDGLIDFSDARRVSVKDRKRLRSAAGT